MKAVTFPIYESIFPNEPIPLLHEILAGISSAKMLIGIAFLNSKLHLRQNDLEDQEKVFFNWIAGIDVETRKNILINYKIFKASHYNINIVLFNSVPLIRLMEQIIIHYNEIPESNTYTQEEQLIILKAWLLANQSFRFEIPEKSIPNAKNLFEAIVVNKSIQYEFIRPKKFVYQILYGAAFFEYLKQNDELSIYHQNFLKNVGLKSHQEYIRILVEVYINVFEGEFNFSLPKEAAFLQIVFDSIASNFSKSMDFENAKMLVPNTDLSYLERNLYVKELIAHIIYFILIFL